MIAAAAAAVALGLWAGTVIWFISWLLLIYFPVRFSYKLSLPRVFRSAVQHAKLLATTRINFWYLNNNYGFAELSWDMSGFPSSLYFGIGAVITFIFDFSIFIWLTCSFWFFKKWNLQLTKLKVELAVERFLNNAHVNIFLVICACVCLRARL